MRVHHVGSDPTDETTEPSPRQGLLDPLDNHLEGAYDGAASLASWGDGGLRRPSTTSFNDMRRSRQAFDFDTASDMRPFSDDVSTGIEQLNVVSRADNTRPRLDAHGYLSPIPCNPSAYLLSIILHPYHPPPPHTPPPPPPTASWARVG